MKEKNAINIDLHTLLLSVQAQVKSLTLFVGGVDAVSAGDQSVTAKRQGKARAQQASTAAVEQAVSILQASYAPSTLDLQLARVLIHVAMNNFALERASGILTLHVLLTLLKYIRRRVIL